jgi:hypothetical protein
MLCISQALHIFMKGIKRLVAIDEGAKGLLKETLTPCSPKQTATPCPLACRRAVLVKSLQLSLREGFQISGYRMQTDNNLIN